MIEILLKVDGDESGLAAASLFESLESDLGGTVTQINQKTRGGISPDVLIGIGIGVGTGIASNAAYDAIKLVGVWLKGNASETVSVTVAIDGTERTTLLKRGNDSVDSVLDGITRHSDLGSP